MRSQVPVQEGLGPVHSGKYRRNCLARWAAQLLGAGPGTPPNGRGFPPGPACGQGDKHRCQMAVAHRNPQALGGDERGRGEDFPVEQVPQILRVPVRFFLPGDERDHIVRHLGPTLQRLTAPETAWQVQASAQLIQIPTEGAGQAHSFGWNSWT